MITVSEGEFPLSEARQKVRDLMQPNPWIYWTDFLLHVTLGWSAFVVAVRATTGSSLQSFVALVSSLVAALALYRAVIFIHELTHLKKSSFRIFRVVWNLVCGFPLMVPSFTYYGVHNHHHKRNVYGTHDDGEYLPFAAQPPFHMITYLALIFVLPLFFAARFLLLTPLSLLSPALRRLVWQKGSSLTIDLRFNRPPPREDERAVFLLQEVCTFFYALTAVVLALFGLLPLWVFVLWYFVALTVFLLNSLRTLAAHCYRNPGGVAMNVPEQFLDSVDVPGHLFLTALWAPVGLRYHATHHLFPSMPYHNLGKARRRLMRELSDTRLYALTERRGLWDALRRLWCEAKASRVTPRVDSGQNPATGTG